MRFRIDQRVAAPVSQVEAAFIDPSFLAALSALPKLGSPELLDQRVEGDLVHQRVRYAFAGSVSPAVSRVLDPNKMSWVEESTLDHRTHRTDHVVRPDHYPDRLSCSFTTTLDDDAGGTLRRAEGDVRVRAFLVGPSVERAIISGLEGHAQAEADVLERWLSEGA